ncbi:MAG: prepilin-type N-terminal cleavage/methylation domain-containing protein [Candidatus Gracilibacteria bacterium]|nr:prepilin-type N-terminal cleavage/methylation domain-containing protein [Candidatus Gracilibacteria bacterium]
MINNKKSVSKAYYKEKIINKFKQAFTLTEVVVATLISSIVLGFIFIFLGDISGGIVDTKREIILMSHFYDFSYKLNNLRNVYTTGSILVDNTGTGSDVFLMKDISGQNGVLFGVVNIADMKLETDNTVYDDRGVGFRKLSSNELAEVDTNVDFIYDYVFQEDQVFSDLKVQDLNIVSYNSGSIYDLNMSLNLDFQNSLIGQYWTDLPRDDLKKFNIDF